MRNEGESELKRLVRGRGGLLWLSRPERRLLKYALETFGEPLSQLLLAGLGQEEEGRCWLFSVTFADGGDVIRQRDLRVEADKLPDVVTLLPRQREPLLMLALLYLLMNREPFSPTLFYEQREVLELLGWKNTPSSWLSIDKTVERYANLSYRWTLSKEELAEKNLSYYRGWSRFISGYGYQEVEEIKGEPMNRVSNRVDFSIEFLNALVTRSLFDVNWHKVSSVVVKKADD